MARIDGFDNPGFNTGRVFQPGNVTLLATFNHFLPDPGLLAGVINGTGMVYIGML